MGKNNSPGRKAVLHAEAMGRQAKFDALSDAEKALRNPKQWVGTVYVGKVKA